MNCIFASVKIVQLNTYDGNGGAGRACLRLNKALVEHGIDSELWVSFKFGKNPDIKSFSDGSFSRPAEAFGILLERFVSSKLVKKLKIPFSASVWGTDISKHPVLKQADIIHIHWVNHGFLRPADIQKLKQLNKPIVWTFHDSNAFTGGCHVRYDCNHFENECGNCPILRASGPKDWSHKNWQDKFAAYAGLDISIVAPSSWMSASVKRSKLLGDRNVYVIPNTLDTEVFKPHNKLQARINLGLSPDKFIILSGFMPSRNDLHKGTPYLLEAIDLLLRDPSVIKESVELLVFGNRDAKNVPDFPIKATFLGTISDDNKLAECYSASDMFITPSLEDNLPNTVMESLSCGTPVVAFTTGGIPDMVNHLKNGYLAQYRSSQDLCNGVLWVYNHQDKKTLNENSRRTVEQNFSESVIANRHEDLYHRVLNPTRKIPMLTIITVVYNNAKDIERTMLSVLNQTYPHIEYIVIDGQSTDGTLDLIKKYTDRIAKWISEKDDGIYHAMNKGLEIATGDFVLFINSGDEIYAGDTVEKVFKSSLDADIYYGETEMYDFRWNSLGRRRHQSPDNFTWKSFKYGMSVSHQAIYVRRSLTEPFDLNYQLSSDIDWILKAVKKARKIVNTNIYVAKYLVDGMSKKRHRESLKERFLIFTKHYGLLPNLINHVVIATKLGWYYINNRKTND